jgi:hypothetical protein
MILGVQALADHLAIARFEDVQRKRFARKEDEVQRKQCNAVRLHGSHRDMIPEAGLE